MKQAPSEHASARGLRVAIVRSRFNPAVTDGLLEGARQALAEMGAGRSAVVVVDVPGPPAAQERRAGRLVAGLEK